MDYFDRCITFVLKQEGGYVNDPRDAGGETNFGISKRAYPGLDIKALTVEQAKEIYSFDYWLKAGCDKLAWPDCLVVFDTAINMGVGRAKVFEAAALNWSDFLFMRIEHYVGLNQPAFLRGWINRCLALWREAKIPTDEHPGPE